MQSNLQAFFAGKREVVELPPKRGPGRPRKVKEEAPEQQDVAFEAVRAQPVDWKAVEDDLPSKRHKSAVSGPASSAVVEALGKPFSQLRMPGADGPKPEPAVLGCKY